MSIKSRIKKMKLVQEAENKAIHDALEFHKPIVISLSKMQREKRRALDIIGSSELCSKQEA